MRKRRRALGWTQFELAQLSGVDVGDIQAMERFRYVPGKLRIVNHKLNRVAQTLEMDFDTLFPCAYLRALQKMKSPLARGTFRWMREISLDELPEEDLSMDLLDNPSQQIEYRVDHWALRQTLYELLGEVPPRERFIVEKRFGLDGSDAETLVQVAQHLGVTPQRIRQLEARALRRLRHSGCFKRLRDFKELL